jgi:hypothetical protein
VVILNDSRILGQADAARAPVEDAGFTVLRVGNYNGTWNVPKPTVFYEDADEAAARTMLDLVHGVAEMVPIRTTNITRVEPGTLVLVVTRDFPTELTR